MTALLRWSWVFGFTGGVALAASGLLWIALGSFDGSPAWFAGSGIASIVLWLALDYERVGNTVRSRTFAYGSGSTLLVVMMGVAALGTFVLAKRHDHTWDLTRTGEFTPSEHTRSVIGALEEPVSVLAFFRDGSGPQREFHDQARALQELSPRLTVTWIDPLARPLLAKQHEVAAENGTVILRTEDGRTRRIDGHITEERFTEALVLLQSHHTHQVCWALGHGEADPDDERSPSGLGAAVFELEDLNYQVVKRTIPTEGIGRDCDLLVIARPEQDWMGWEREALAAYVAEGGRALVLLDPDQAPGLADELERYGVKVGHDVVLDLNPQNQLLGVDDPSYVVLTDDNLLPHPITANLGGAVVLGLARSVRPMEGAEGLTVREVLKTSEQAWGETQPEGEEVFPNPGEEVVGHVPVMVTVEVDDPTVLEVATADSTPPQPSDPTGWEGDPTRGVPSDLAEQPGGRLVVIGDADFASNRFLIWRNNLDLFLNSLAWLADEEEQIGERPSRGDPLELTALGGITIVLVNVLLVPGLAVMWAVATLVRRRFL